MKTAIARFTCTHPYLLFGEFAIPWIRDRANSNQKLIARLKASLEETALASHRQELRTRIKRHGRRLIHTAFLAAISSGETKAHALAATRAALAELAAEPNWKARPVIKSFLDCAEIAVAVSLAYDWLYHELSGEERRNVEDALLRHVLAPALAAYDDPFSQWPRRRDNCTLVSNSGILVSALAVLDRYRDLSQQLVCTSLVSSWNVFDGLAPDGAWPEGPSYWSLAMRYAGLMVAALESTLGDSFGLAERPGFAQTGDFALHAVGPFGAAFNFGDSEPCFDMAPLAWFAHRFRRPTDAHLIDQYDGWFLPFTVIWPKRPRTKPGEIKVPTGKVFHSNNLACFRNTWSRAPAAHPVYLAIKGGNVSGPGARSPPLPEDVFLHSQADAGSFILDGARQRWIIDLGADDYDLPGYFDHGADNRSGPRWRYYRAQTAGHNTLVIDGRNQLPDAHAPIIGSRVDGDCKWAVFDLSAAYGWPAGAIRRGAALIGRQVVVQDEVAPGVTGTIVWAVHTSAEPVSVTGSVARFRAGEDRFVLRILEPAEACFEIGFPPEPQVFPIADVRQLHGRQASDRESVKVAELPRRVDEDGRRAAGALIRRLQILWPEGTRRLSVALLPDCDDGDLALPVTPLDQWLARRPVRLASYSRRASWINVARPAAKRMSRASASAPPMRLPRKPTAERAALG
ncbi:MAG: heparinase II/III family protein [Alphaproteobacteria bacterium]|nr:heparinase II/III family protein [Alphaproteobacteria bacterium]